MQRSGAQDPRQPIYGLERGFLVQDPTLPTGHPAARQDPPAADLWTVVQVYTQDPTLPTGHPAARQDPRQLIFGLWYRSIPKTLRRLPGVLPDARMTAVRWLRCLTPE